MREIIAAGVLLAATTAHACDSHRWRLDTDIGVAGQLNPQYWRTDRWVYNGRGFSDAYSKYPIYRPGPMIDFGVHLTRGHWSIGYRHVSAIDDGVKGAGLDLLEVTTRWTLWKSR